MTIEQIDETRLIIALCNEDMQVFSLDFDTMGFNDPHSRRILKRLLKLAGSRTGISVSDKTLVVEAMPHAEGCIFLITLVPKGEGERKKYKIKKPGGSCMYTFEKLEHFLCCTQHLYEAGFLFEGSSTYLYKDRYYLILTTGKSLPFKAQGILNEFSLEKATGKLTVSKIKEFGKVIAKNHTILRIGSAMVNR